MHAMPHAYLGSHGRTPQGGIICILANGLRLMRVGKEDARNREGVF